MRNLTPWAESGRMDQSLKLAIRDLRQQNGLTQQECAGRADMSDTSRWSNLERAHGQAKPLSLEQLETVGEAIGETTEAIIRRARELDER